MNNNSNVEKESISNLTGIHKSLFPIQNEAAGGNCLFPSVAGNRQISTPSVISDNLGSNLEWLENKSFTTSSYSAYKTFHAQIEEEKRVNEPASQLPVEHKTKSDVSIVTISDEEDESKSSHRKKDKRKKDKKKKKHKKERKRTHSPEFPSDIKKSKADSNVGIDFGPGKLFLEDIPALLSHKAYRIDRKKDKILLTYESLAKQHIANYKPSWKQCIGLKHGHKLLCETSNKDKSVVRYYGKNEIKTIRLKGVKVIPSTSSNTDDLKLSHLSISADVKDVDLNENPLGILDSATTSYIHGEGVTQPSTEIIIFHDEKMQEVACYNRRLQEEPGNVDLWLEFVKFQDKLFETTSGVNNQFKTKSSSSLAAIEKRLSILDKALENNPSSMQLKLAQLEIGKDVWDEDKVRKEWDQLLFVNAGNVTMWRHYLLRQQSDLLSFRVSRIIGLYHKCFKMVISVLEGRINTIRESNNTSSDFIELFHQYCRFLQQCGQVEKAVSSIQAIIEFNEFCPDRCQEYDTETRTIAFECFWNSSVPRFGEDDAKGWKFWDLNQSNEKRNSISNTDPNEELEDVIIKTKDKFQAWLDIESLRESNSWLPWKPDISKGESEEDCKDFERLVLFDDISSVLFKIQDKDSLLRLIIALLDITGFTSEWSSDVLGIPLPVFQYKTEFQQLFLYELRQLLITSDFKIGICLSNIWKPSLILTKLIQNILKTGSDLFEVNSYSRTVLILLWIQFELTKYGSTGCENISKSKMKEIRKSVKMLLKDVNNRNNLIVWNAYTKLELALGKKGDALNIAQTALTMYDSSANSHNCDDQQKYSLQSMYQTYCELLLDINLSNLSTISGQSSPSKTNPTTAMYALRCLSENSKFDSNKMTHLSGSEILKVKKKFQTLIECDLKILNTEFTRIKVCYLHSLFNCSAIFEYASSGIQSAVDVYDNIISICHSISLPAEGDTNLLHLKQMLLHSQLFLIKSHMSVSAMPLMLLRRCLNRSLQLFPNQMTFLQMFVVLEERSHISCRLRKYFDSVIKHVTTPIPVVLAVLAEMSRQCTIDDIQQTTGTDLPAITETGISNRIRSLFERGLQNSVCQHCPLLWRLYIAFEVKMGQMERAKGLFYRALQLCPSSKVLYTDAVRLFGEGILQEVVDLMTEKELRVHLPLEEMDILINSDMLE